MQTVHSSEQNNIILWWCSINPTKNQTKSLTDMSEFFMLRIGQLLAKNGLVLVTKPMNIVTATKHYNDLVKYCWNNLTKWKQKRLSLSSVLAMDNACWTFSLPDRILLKWFIKPKIQVCFLQLPNYIVLFCGSFCFLFFCFSYCYFN